MCTNEYVWAAGQRSGWTRGFEIERFESGGRGGVVSGSGSGSGYQREVNQGCGVNQDRGVNQRLRSRGVFGTYVQIWSSGKMNQRKSAKKSNESSESKSVNHAV